jgi:hypothetical protein
MNCHEFQNRLDRILDERGDFSHDARLLDHSRECDSCRQSLELWQGIDFALQTPRASTQRFAERDPVKVTIAVGALAAAMLLIASAGTAWLSTPWNTPGAPVSPLVERFPQETGSPPEQSSQRIVANSALAPETIVAVFDGVRRPLAVKSDAEAEAFWGTLQSDQWMVHTMPAVNSVREGVAPIGRSVRRALAILLTDTPETSLQESPRSKEVPVDAMKEQAYDALETERLATIA